MSDWNPSRCDHGEQVKFTDGSCSVCDPPNRPPFEAAWQAKHSDATAQIIEGMDARSRELAR